MSGRCKACNVILDEHEMTALIDGEYTELCTYCSTMSKESDDEIEESEEKMDYSFFNPGRRTVRYNE